MEPSAASPSRTAAPDAASRRPRARVALLLALAAPVPAGADTISLPAGTLERSGQAELRYRPDEPLTGEGRLEVEWRDAVGRLVERQVIPVALTRATRIPFRLDLRRAVATSDSVEARLVLGRRDAVARTATASFVAPPPAGPWSDWQAVIWQPRGPAQLAALRRMGVTAGMVPASRDDAAPVAVDDKVAPFLRQDLRWYVENIATDFYAAYHRWRADAPANAAFLEAKEFHREDPQGVAAFLRGPSLSDPGWLRRIGDRLARTVRAHAPYRPLYYSLADEPGVGDLAAAWDFDLSPASLAGMRAWLRAGYGGLDALNRQWGTGFAGWDEVVPPTTDQTMRRTDENFSGWSDFKAWMDEAFARAVRSGTAAVHAADPRALAAIEGAQIPGWGGYDYARLAGAVDAMEIYDAGANVDILRSLNPRLVLLTTVYGGGAQSTHHLWHAVLRGARGAILWDERDELAGEDGSPGPWGREIAPVLGELRDGLGSLLINSRRETAPVAVLYSPPSFRVQWMLDRRPQGPAWAARDAETEYEDATVAAATEGFARLLDHLGLEPRFVTPDGLGRGALRARACRVLVLPHAVALSPAEASEIRRFAGGGGTVIADVTPGLFDQHGRRLDRPSLADLFPTGSDGRPPVRDAGGAVLFPPGRSVDPGPLGRLRLLLRRAGVEPGFAVSDRDGRPAGDVEMHRYRNGGVTILALLRELRPRAGERADRADAARPPLRLRRPRPACAGPRQPGAARPRPDRARDPGALGDAPAGTGGGRAGAPPGGAGRGGADPAGRGRGGRDQDRARRHRRSLREAPGGILRQPADARRRRAVAVPARAVRPPGAWQAWVTDALAAGRRVVVPFAVVPLRRASAAVRAEGAARRGPGREVRGLALLPGRREGREGTRARPPAARAEPGQGRVRRGRSAEAEQPRERAGTPSSTAAASSAERGVLEMRGPVRLHGARSLRAPARPAALPSLVLRGRDAPATVAGRPLPGRSTARYGTVFRRPRSKKARAGRSRPVRASRFRSGHAVARRASSGRECRPR